MSHNAIEKFESAAFENCVNMTVLDLSHNSIASFARGTFDELSYATVFLLSYNQLTNMSSVNCPHSHTHPHRFFILFLFLLLFVFVGTARQYDRFEIIECITQSNRRNTKEFIPEII